MSGVRATIFDFDGVLADSEPLHFRTFAAVLAEEGIRITQDSAGTRYVGVSDREAFELAFLDHGRGSLTPEACGMLLARKSRLYRGGLAEVELFHGARELLLEARRRGPATIASCALRGDIEGVLDRHGLRGAFPRFVSADDVSRSKPDPECFLRALDILREEGPRDLSPRDCIVFEDSTRGVEAARRAGMRCVAVATSFRAGELRAADAVIASLAEWRWPD
ncbi:MAG: HAD family phosphatase [Planctomycetes bacterium]|nr:HAD family phosphatase [Planctomycetota bacterium]